MPIYEYKCEKCGKIKDYLFPTTFKDSVKCSDCEINMDRIISAGSFRLKGAGFYVNDYKMNEKHEQHLDKKAQAVAEKKEKEKKRAERKKGR